MNKKDFENIDPAWEKALRLMEQSDEVTPEEISEMMEGDECMQACRDLWKYKISMQRRHVARTPDADKEWKRFHARNVSSVSRRKTFFVGAFCGGIAASLLLFIFFSWMQHREADKPVMAFRAVDNTQQVLLLTDEGTGVALSKSATKALNALNGTVVQADSNTIAYRTTATDEAPKQHILSTPRGEDFKVVLADGTEVWLNAESLLEYPSRFTGKERRVKLRGEAYFHVTEDKQHPFVVEAEGVQTCVLGTEFNIRNYTLNDSHITLVKGSVEVRHSLQAKPIRVAPGEDAFLQPDGSFTLSEVDTDIYTYWKEGYFFFDNTALVDIMQHIGRWYNVNVVFNHPRSMKYKMHYFCNRKEPLEQAIEQLNRIEKVTATLENNTVYIQ